MDGRVRIGSRSGAGGVPVTTARETLHLAADAIFAGLQPQARATATATTFRQFGDIAGSMPLTVADLVAGLEVIGRPGDSDPPPTSARRGTCREIAELFVPGNEQLRAALFSPGSGDPRRLAAAWRAIASHFAGSADPRQATIVSTLTREILEIEP